MQCITFALYQVVEGFLLGVTSTRAHFAFLLDRVQGGVSRFLACGCGSEECRCLRAHCVKERVEVTDQLIQRLLEVAFVEIRLLVLHDDDVVAFCQHWKMLVRSLVGRGEEIED